VYVCYLRRFAALTEDLREALDVAREEVAASEAEEGEAAVESLENSTSGSLWGITASASRMRRVAERLEGQQYLQNCSDALFFTSVIRQLDAALAMMDSRM